MFAENTMSSAQFLSQFPSGSAASRSFTAPLVSGINVRRDDSTKLDSNNSLPAGSENGRHRTQGAAPPSGPITQVSQTRHPEPLQVLRCVCSHSTNSSAWRDNHTHKEEVELCLLPRIRGECRRSKSYFSIHEPNKRTFFQPSFHSNI